jgi:hypothetical protein
MLDRVLIRNGWIAGGGGKGQPYVLQPETPENRSADSPLGLVRWSPRKGENQSGLIIRFGPGLKRTNPD